MRNGITDGPSPLENLLRFFFFFEKVLRTPNISFKLLVLIKKKKKHILTATRECQMIKTKKNINETKSDLFCILEKQTSWFKRNEVCVCVCTHGDFSGKPFQSKVGWGGTQTISNDWFCFTRSKQTVTVIFFNSNNYTQ